MKRLDHKRYRDKLVIDKDRLDESLMDQADTFYHVSENLSLAIAERDALQLELVEKEAAFGERLRAEAIEKGTRLTENAVKQKIQTASKLKILRGDLLEATQRVNEWMALKGAFRQRSLMLKQLVSLRLGERRDYRIESDGGEARDRIAERNKELLRRSRGR